VQLGYTQTGRNYPVQLDGEKAYVNVPWTDHYAWSDITDKPKFATVATSGSYNDLSNKPSIPSVSGSVSGSTLTITINGSSYSLTDTNTWRPIGTGANDAAAGNHLHDDRYLKLAGGSMNSGARIDFSGGNGYIGNANNAGWLMVQDICSQDGAGDTYWSLRTNGNAHFANVYSAGYVTALSDARKKRVMGDVVLSAEQIAKMPAVRFEWKDPKKPGMFIGTLAQNWREILPEAVHTLGDGTFEPEDAPMAEGELVELKKALLEGASWHQPDHYFLLLDFESYMEAKLRAIRATQDEITFAKMCLNNIAGAGKFSSDRTIRQYCEEIWHLEPTKI
jgi:hypothetical protein